MSSSFRSWYFVAESSAREGNAPAVFPRIMGRGNRATAVTERLHVVPLAPRYD